VKLQYIGTQHLSVTSFRDREVKEVSKYQGLYLLRTWGTHFNIVELSEEESKFLDEKGIEHDKSKVVKRREATKVDEKSEKVDKNTAEFIESFLGGNSKEQLEALEEIEDKELLKLIYENTEYVTVKKAIEKKLGDE
jgi:hypothetical protein